ncbi:TPA: inositol-3-phosphate synthase [Candidatus Bathyarchaeota archaeon]|nr:inositol-3-phosphate synthase [Candidatus Bathyarchaeota archaeon]
MGEIRVAVAGAGNLCSSTVQGTHFYAKAKEPLGLLHPTLGGYKPTDIKFVAAFDISEAKVDKDLSEAIFAKSNNAPKIVVVPKLGVVVKMGPTPDLIEGTLSSIKRAKAEAVDVAAELKKAKTDILINMVSGGSDKASTLYAQAAIDAGCAYINATPSSIAGDAALVKKFTSTKLPLAGDDLLDQVGATAIHIGILEFLHSRGAHIDESYQLDVGGGAESISTLEKTKDTKRRIKTAAVTGHVPYKFPLVSGSTDFVDFLGNGRDSFFWVKGRYFGGVPFTMDLKLSSEDAPNGGSILLDAIRGMKVAKDKGEKGLVAPVCGYAFKRAERTSLAKAYEAFRELTG